MVDPYKGVSELVRKRTSKEYRKQFRIELVELLEERMEMYKMTWADLERKLEFSNLRHSLLSGRDAVCEYVSMDDIFDLFEALGCRPVILGAPRDDVASV